tara:strand:+ start:952 stop:1638 length:687 start_codon:yes stop_codon:yes gene_type:complete
MEIHKLFQNKDPYTNIFIILVGVSFIQYFDIKIIVSMVLFILLVLNFSNILQSTDTSGQIKQDIKKKEISDDMYYNTIIHDLLIRLKPYKKYNKISYKEGVKYMRKFFNTVRILENDNIYNYNQYFENALLYLKNSINHFQSITISLPERSMIDGIKKGDFESTKKTNELGSICKQLYNECYYILHNLSIKFNEIWSKEPHMYIKEIEINTDRVESYNEMDEVKWSLY